MQRRLLQYRTLRRSGRLPRPNLRRKYIPQYLKDVQLDRRVEGRRGGGTAAVFDLSVIQNRRGSLLLLLEHGVDLVVEIERADPYARDGLGLPDSTNPVCETRSSTEGSPTFKGKESRN
jgi:hypothetical protein